MTPARQRLPEDKTIGAIAVAPTPKDVDAQWMTAVLHAAKIIDAETVTAVSFKPVGQGMMSDSFRFTLQYDRPSSAPATVVGKFAAADPTSKSTAGTYAVYFREVGFYRDLAHTIDAHLPPAYFARIDTESNDFTLIMEDQAPARVVDQIGGCSLEDARTAVREAARLHGPRWNDKTLAEVPALRRGAVLNQTTIEMLPGLVNGFIDRFTDRIDLECKKGLDRLPALVRNVLSDTRALRTLQHGDFRLDNMLFDVKGETGSVVVLDWGTIAWASGLSDVSYFIGSSLNAVQRRDHERTLVREYFDALSKYAIGNYDWDACWKDYIRFCYQGLFTAVSASMLVERSDRADQLFLGMMRSNLEQMNALGTFTAWD